MARGADVVVLGAGLAGCASAYFLARDGAKVTVVERDAIGSGASGYALGALNPMAGSYISGPARPLAEASFNMHMELWPQLEEAADMDIQARTLPHLDICLSPEDVADTQAEMTRWEETAGFVARWLEPEQVRRLEPRITHDLAGAALLEDVGILDSYRFTLALAKAAERRGAEFVTGEVVGLRSSGSRVTGVKLSGDEISCEATVVPLGPWSGQAADWLGLNVPVRPLKGQILHLEGLNPPLRHDLGTACHVLDKADGLLWIGATEEDVGFDTGATAEARELLMQAAMSMVPGLGEQRLVRRTACLRPVTPDRLPVLGRAPGWDGVFLATGAEKKGILLAPAMGRAVADLIMDGETSLPISPFAAERFA